MFRRVARTSLISLKTQLPLVLELYVQATFESNSKPVFAKVQLSFADRLSLVLILNAARFDEGLLPGLRSVSGPSLMYRFGEQIANRSEFARCLTPSECGLFSSRTSLFLEVGCSHTTLGSTDIRHVRGR